MIILLLCVVWYVNDVCTYAHHIDFNMNIYINILNYHTVLDPTIITPAAD